MLDVGIQADQFFLNIAAIHQQRRLLQHPVGVGLRTDQFLHAGSSTSPDRFAGSPGDACSTPWRGFADCAPSLAEFALNAASFFFPHLVQPGKASLGFREHGSFQFLMACEGGGISIAPGMRKNHVQVGLRRQAELRGGGAKGLNVRRRPAPDSAPCLRCWSVPGSASVPRVRVPAFLSTARRSFISSASVSDGMRKCKSRKRWLTDFKDRVKPSWPLAWPFTCAKPVMERMGMIELTSGFRLLRFRLYELQIIQPAISAELLH